MMRWIPAHQPPLPGDELPAERRIVLVWLSNRALPFCGYLRWHSAGPFWVVYHGNMATGSDVVWWCDLPIHGPTPQATEFMLGYGAPAQHFSEATRYTYGLLPALPSDDVRDEC